jgi:hypothetical protein
MELDNIILGKVPRLRRPKTNLSLMIRGEHTWEERG